MIIRAINDYRLSFGSKLSNEPNSVFVEVIVVEPKGLDGSPENATYIYLTRKDTEDLMIHLKKQLDK